MIEFHQTATVFKNVNRLMRLSPLCTLSVQPLGDPSSSDRGQDYPTVTGMRFAVGQPDGVR